MRNFIPKSARLIPEKAVCVFKGKIFDVYQWEQEMYDGTTKTFEMLKRPDTVRVIAIKDGRIVVLEQEQPGLGFSYDFPGGRHDVETESELDAAKRELLEEAGMKFKKWKLVHAYNSQIKIDWLVYTFIAEDFESQDPQKLDAGEKIKITCLTFDELKQLIKNPHARSLTREIVEAANSLEDLLALPDISKA